MLKKLVMAAVGTLMLSGCSLTLPGSIPGTSLGQGSIWKSTDSGTTYEPKADIDAQKKISAADVVSFVFHPDDDQTIYIGTLGSGLFKTTDGAEHWVPITFPPIKNYGLAIDQKNGSRLFASGVLGTIAKIYRTEDGGDNWKEIYTEPGKGTVITSLVSHPDDPDILYAGTSAGVIIKSVDGGGTWKNLALVKGPVTKIALQRGEKERVALLILNQGVITSTNGGTTWNDLTKIAGASSASNQNSVVDAPETTPQGIISLAGDPTDANVFYIGSTTGLFKSTDSGKTWTTLPIIESSKNLPIRAIAINPNNSLEISYAAGQAFYKSLDGGTHWATTQLEIDRGVSTLQYSKSQPGVLYFTLRKY